MKHQKNQPPDVQVAQVTKRVTTRVSYHLWRSILKPENLSDSAAAHPRGQRRGGGKDPHFVLYTCGLMMTGLLTGGVSSATR